MKNNNLNLPRIHKSEVFTSSTEEVVIKYSIICGSTGIEDVSLTDLQNVQKVLNEFLKKEK